jgi:hypothetical protein
MEALQTQNSEEIGKTTKTFHNNQKPQEIRKFHN